VDKIHLAQNEIEEVGSGEDGNALPGYIKGDEFVSFSDRLTASVV
jgi:hypothetical protein